MLVSGTYYRLMDDVDVFEHARLVLAYLMHHRDLRQEDLAPILRISQPRVSDRLLGKSRLTIAEIDRAARYFDVPHAVFFDPEISEELVSSPSVSSASAPELVAA